MQNRMRWENYRTNYKPIYSALYSVDIVGLYYNYYELIKMNDMNYNLLYELWAGTFYFL